MKKVILATLALVPVFTFAQVTPPNSVATLSNVQAIITSISGLINTALPVVVALGLIGFFWGLVKFIFAQGNEEAKTDAKKIMLWGLIALFVMVSVWGLVSFLGAAFGIQSGGTVTVPTVTGLQ